MTAIRKIVSDLTAVVAVKSTLASPVFTGVPAAPTAAAGTNTTQLATTAFVRGEVARYRAPAANAALTLAATDGVIKLQSTDATNVAATMTATHAGHEITVFLDVRSATGSYTLGSNQAGIAGDVTLDLAEDGALLVYSGTAWEVVALLGGATWA